MKKLSLYLILVCCALLSACTKKQEQPNIVFIFPDQYRRQAVGFMDKDPVITPNIDRLASEGVVFNNATSTIPVCSPFRAMLLTGNFYTVNNVPQNCNSNHPGLFLRTEDYTLLDGLNDGGYDVAYIGKWHLEEPKEPFVESGNNGGVGRNNWEEWTPPERRHGVKFWYAYNTFDNHFIPHYWTNESTRDNRVQADEWSPQHETSVAIDYIKNESGVQRDPNKPFAVFLSYNPPHTGYSYVPQEYKDLYKDTPFEELNTLGSVKPGSGGEAHAKKVLANYFACVSGVDDQVGRMMDFLKEEGLYENTIFVFTSDHGNCVGAHNHVTKTNFWEESFGVPLIVSWPGNLKHKRTDLLFTPTDFFPTLAGLAGFDLPEVQGKDLSDQIMDGTGYEHDGTLYAYLNFFNVDTLISGYPGKSWGERGFRSKEYMLLVNKLPDQLTEYYLSDLKNDPWQQTNIALQNRHVVEAILEEQLNPKLEEIGDDWYKIPLTKGKVYPNGFRTLPDDASIWGLR
ncbi:MAG: sulfatase [Bacteroidales bacterium]|nr:sulfatase [Bacteroidales bacterium]